MGKIKKSLSAIGGLMSLVDTVTVIKHLSDKSVPLIDKAIDRHYDSKRDLITIQNLQHLDLDFAKDHLESLGLIVVPILVNPQKKYRQKRPNEVIGMSPKSGKLPPGSLVKLYYIDQASLAQSRYLFEEEVAKSRRGRQALAEGFKKTGKVFKRRK